MVHVVRQLPQRPGVPVGGDALGVERRELALELADHREVQVRGLVRRPMAHDRSRFARIMIAVMAEIDHAPADLHLQASCGAQLGHEEPPREEPAGLLAERDDWPGHSTWGASTWPPTPPIARDAPGNPGRPSTLRRLIRRDRRRRQRAAAGWSAAPR